MINFISGVDDAFHLIHAWQNYSSISSVRKRMANVVNAVGPGITITSVTNILAFATGSITAPPMVSFNYKKKRKKDKY